MKISNFQAAEAALQPYVPLVAELAGKDTTLNRIRPLMALLGNPQDRLKTVHIAGTSGKTSTAYYMAALLSASGRRVGLTVSPHVESLAERVQINGRPLGEADFCRQLGEFLDIVQSAGQRPSYFELLYAFALWLLAKQDVDYTVIETGVGGLHDATNIVTRADKICTITDIALDHTRLLGDTLAKIAAQKVGIVHESNQVFMYGQDDSVMPVIERWTARHNAPLHVLDYESVRMSRPIPMKNLPAYQQRNWLLAYQVYKYLQDRDKLPFLTSQVLARTQLTHIPGRMDSRQVQGKTLILDGAHNAQKMSALVDSFRRLHPGVKPAVLLALKAGKDYGEVVAQLAPLAGRIILTTFRTSQDLPVESLRPAALRAAFEAHGFSGQVTEVTDLHQAFQALLSAPEKIGLITGSFYLLAQILNNEQLDESSDRRR